MKRLILLIAIILLNKISNAQVVLNFDQREAQGIRTSQIVFTKAGLTRIVLKLFLRQIQKNIMKCTQKCCRVLESISPPIILFGKSQQMDSIEFISMKMGKWIIIYTALDQVKYRKRKKWNLKSC